MYHDDSSWCRNGLSGGQFLKRHRVGSNHVPKRIYEQIGTVAAVEAEAHFVQIGLQMLGAETVPRPDDASRRALPGFLILYSGGVVTSWIWALRPAPQPAVWLGEFAVQGAALTYWVWNLRPSSARSQNSSDSSR
jgi:hypothetical protein